MDAAGWYQLLRKFQKDISPASLAMKSLNSLQGVNVGNIDDAAGGILSLGISPDRAKGQMLVMSRHPSELKVFLVIFPDNHSN